MLPRLKKRMRKVPWRRVLVTVAIVAAALVVALPLSLVALLQTDSGRQTAVDVIESLASSDDAAVTLGRLDGSVPFDMRLSSVALADRDGVWLEIHDVALSWRALPLLVGHVAIDSLSIDRLTVLRRPAAAAPAAEPDGGSGGLPPISVTLDKLSVGVVSLHEDVPGGPATFSVDGALSLNGSASGISARATLSRLDEPGGKLAAVLDLDPSTGRFRLDASLREPANGFVAKLFDRPAMPALELTLKGAGTPDAFQTRLSLTAGGRSALTGAVDVVADDRSRVVTAELAGDLAGLVPTGWDGLLGGPVALKTRARLGPGGSVVIDPSTLKLPGIAADLSGQAGVAGASDLLSLKAEIGTRGNGPLRLPIGEAGLTLDTVTLGGRIGKAKDGLSWRVVANGSAIAAGAARIADIDIRLDGTADTPHLAKASTYPASLGGRIGGIDTGDAALNALLGDVVLSAAAVGNRDGTLLVKNSAIRAAAFTTGFNGSLSGDTATGRVSLQAPDLARVAEQAGRPLSGTVDIAADGTIAFAGAPVDVTLAGKLDRLRTGQAWLDGLIGGSSTLTGAVSRDRTGRLTLDKVGFEGNGLSMAATGTMTAETADLDLTAAVKNLAGIDPRLAGRIDLGARLEGPAGAPELRLTGRGDGIALNGQPLDQPRLEAVAVLSPDRPSGDLALNARLKDAAVEAKASLTTGADGVRKLEGFRLVVGRNVVEAALSLPPGGLPAGSIVVQAPDISELAPLAFIELAGAIAGRADFTAAQATPKVDVKLSVKNLRAATTSLAGADVTAQLRDPLGTLAADAVISARGIDAGGTPIDKLDIRARPDGRAVLVEADVKTPDAGLQTTSRIVLDDGAVDVEIRRLDARHRSISAKLAEPARIRAADGTVIVEKTVLAVGAGRVAVAGTVADKLDLSLDISELPLSIVDAVAPGTGAGGTLNASARITGARDAPRAEWTVKVGGAGIAAARQAGIPALNAAATGVFAKDGTSLDLRVGGITGLDVTAKGSVPAAPTGRLKLAVRGSVPFALISKPLADAGAALTGAAKLAIDISGPAGSPVITGVVTTAGAAATHVDSGTVVRDLAARIGLTRDRVRIETLTGRLERGGRIAASGTVDLKQPGMPGNLKLTVRDGRYVDGTLVAATFAADLQVDGQLAAAPRVGGRVTLDRVEINIPENVPGGAAALDVTHKNAPKPVERQNAEIAPKKKADGGNAKAGIDLTISAPARIFIRGRGLDAELGGTLAMRGPVSAPFVDGGFSMRRGRLDILSRRLDFARGVVTFAGDFDPRLDFAANTKASNTAITIKVTGSAAAPEFSFTSSPELPQDEVLSRFLFDRGIDKLSALQLAQLAAEIAKLTGKAGGPGIVDRIRQGIGVDRLEATTDEQGKSAVSAGKYVSDNVYLGVKQGTGRDSTRVTIDLDVTDGVKARGEVGSDGSSKAGIFFERDY